MTFKKNIFPKNSKTCEKHQKFQKIIFRHSHRILQFKIYFLFNVFKKNQNSNKYVFNAFASISYFVNTFLIKLIFMLFLKNIKIKKKGEKSLRP